MKVIMNMEINKNMKEKYYYLVNAIWMNIAKTFRVGYNYIAYKYTKYNKGNSGKKGNGNKNPKDNNSYSDVSFDSVVEFNH